MIRKKQLKQKIEQLEHRIETLRTELYKETKNVGHQLMPFQEPKTSPTIKGKVDAIAKYLEIKIEAQEEKANVVVIEKEFKNATPITGENLEDSAINTSKIKEEASE